MPTPFVDDVNITNSDGETVVKGNNASARIVRPTLEDYKGSIVEHHFKITGGELSGNIVADVIYMAIKTTYIDHVTVHTDTDAAAQFSVSADGVPQFRLAKVKAGTTVAEVLTDIPISGTSADTSAAVEDTDWAWIGDAVTAEGIAGTQVTFDLSTVSLARRTLAAGERLLLVKLNVSSLSADATQLANAVGTVLGADFIR